MLGATLVFAVIQLAAACGCYALAHSSKDGRVTSLGLLLGAVGVVISLFCLMSPVLLLQLMVLLITGLIALALNARKQTFAGAACVASLLAIAGFGSLNVQHYSTLRDEYPLVSLRNRLAYEAHHVKPKHTVSPHPSTSPEIQPSENIGLQSSGDELVQLEDMFDENYAFRSFSRWSRHEALRLVHASQVEQFQESPGFGVGRGVRPSVSTIPLPETPPIEMPPSATSAPPNPLSADPLAAIQSTIPPPLTDAPELLPYHGDALVNFSNPEGFGYVRNRDHVAGFQPHAFRRLPETWQATWKTERVELVSLLKHEPPAVYVSKHLPNMSELRDAPVRPLDKFEQMALTALQRDGKQLMAETTPNRIRMLGAVRAMRQCSECHLVERGTLLGAFSYDLHRSTPHKEPAKSRDPPEPVY